MMDENFSSEIAPEPEDVPGQSRTLAQQLAVDGVQWRAQQTPVVEDVVRRLQSQLHGAFASQKLANPRSELDLGAEEEQHLSQETSGNRRHRTGPAPEVIEAKDIAVRKSQSFMHRPRRYLVLSGISAMAVLFAAALGTMALLSQSPSSKVVAPPRIYTWSHQGAYDSKTPQEAFAANVRLTPCISAPSQTGFGAPPQTANVTWLDAGRDYGLALINVTCPHQPQPYKVWLFSLGRDDQRHWGPQAGYIIGNKNADLPSASAPPSEVNVPSWLLLPSDGYSGIRVPGPAGLNPPASVVVWYSSSRTFVFGHVADPATRPVDATSVQVNGQAGWMTEQNGIVIVTSPLAGGSTVFFAGTGAASQVEKLASSAFAHMDGVLSPLPG
jgi:hypothetical protein